MVRVTLPVVIEQALYFTLGLLVAGLSGLMVLPALWARALRLSSHRLQMQVPLSMEDVLAERDLLRADFAAREYALEQRLERIADLRAKERAELGLCTRDILVLRERLSALEEEVARLQLELTEAQAELGALHLLFDREEAG